MGEFQHGLCGCFDNCTLCIVTYIAPCYVAGKVAETLGENCVLHAVMTILGPCGIYFRAKARGMIREQKGIEGSFGMDCLMHWLCPLCALVQDSQEIRGDAACQAASMARD